MATKKKASKKKASKKKAKKQAKKSASKKTTRKKASTRATATRKKAASRKAKPAKKAAKRKMPRKPKAAASRSEARSARRTMSNDVYDTRYPDSQDARTLAAGQSGSLQGLSKREAADSESVDELLEEGNSFEAGVVSGVERADDSDEREVTTHEVPEDDVPEEYRDEE